MKHTQGEWKADHCRDYFESGAVKNDPVVWVEDIAKIAEEHYK